MTDELQQLKIEKTKPVGRRSRRGLLIGGGLLLIVILVGLAGTGRLRPALLVETVTVSQVYPTQTFTVLNASGYVVAQRKAAVAAKTTGRLEWLGVEEGSRVTAGQVLARLENRDTRATRDQAEAALASAKATLEQARAELVDAERSLKRQQELMAQGIIARADFDAAETRTIRARSAVAAGIAAVRGSDAALRAADIAYDYSLIRAPFDAVVLTKNADIGDIITPLGAAASAKAAVVSIADLNSLQVEADVAEANVGKIREGQPCEILLDALPDSRFRGTVHTIVPTADRSKASVMIKVRFATRDPRVLPEMSAKVAFLERPATAADQRPRTALPPAAVVEQAGKKLVYQLQQGRAVATPVTLGAPIGDFVEVTAGVAAGVKIISKPLDKLRDGARVKTAEK
jgi:RND family efflux transporter MFP subunit